MADNLPITLKQAQAVALKGESSSRLLQKREEVAQTFERLFAKHLVEEMTKNTFEKSENSPASSSHYREYITDALANEMAAQEKLGMAELLRKHWKIDNDGGG